jgi:hypothetical protein
MPLILDKPALSRGRTNNLICLFKYINGFLNFVYIAFSKTKNWQTK